MMSMQRTRHSIHLEALEEARGDLPLEAMEDMVGMIDLLNHNKIRIFRILNLHLDHAEVVDFNPIGGE